jgi:hypothetical protein
MLLHPHSDQNRGGSELYFHIGICIRDYLVKKKVYSFNKDCRMGSGGGKVELQCSGAGVTDKITPN